MSWRKLIFDNYKAKIALLIMAGFLWFFVVSSSEYEQTLSVPVRLVNLREGKVFLQNPPRTVRVHFQGKGTSLLLLSLFGNLRLELDLANVNYAYAYPLKADQVKWASAINIRVLEILAPDTVMVRLDDKCERRLPVRAQLQVVPAADHVLLGEVICSPDSVLVTGANSIVKAMDFVLTQVQEVREASSPVSVKLALLQPNAGKVELQPGAVTATATVEKITEKEIRSVSVVVREVKSGFEALSEPTTVDLRIRGPASLLDKLDNSTLSAQVHASHIDHGGAEAQPQVELPEGVILLSVNPSRVTVKLQRINL